MKKVFAMLLVIIMCVVMMAGCNNNGEQVTTPTQPTVPVVTKSAFELAMEEYISNNNFAKADYQGIDLAYNGNVITVTASSTLEEIKSIFPNVPEDATNAVDVSELEVASPNTLGVKERLTYNNINDVDGQEVEYWSFFADSSVDGNSLMWLEIDPLGGYDGRNTVSINGITIANSLKDAIELWGTPDTVSASLVNGKDVVTACWKYVMGSDEGYEVCVYVCTAGVDGADFENADVYNIYVNLMSIK